MPARRRPVVHDHGSEFVNRDVAAVIKTDNLIDIKGGPSNSDWPTYCRQTRSFVHQ
jgi:hypothetical protein